MRTIDETEIAPGIYVSYNNFHLKVRVVRDGREVVFYLDPAATAKLGSFIAGLSHYERTHRNG